MLSADAKLMLLLTFEAKRHNEKRRCPDANVNANNAVLKLMLMLRQGMLTNV